MESQQNQQKPQSKFNWALLLGCCVIALAIGSVGNDISNAAGRMNFQQQHVPFVQHQPEPPREFMSQWDVAHFLMMDYAEVVALIESGELAGTYAVFQVERAFWRPVLDIETHDSGVDGNEASALWRTYPSPNSVQVAPVPARPFHEAEIVSEVVVVDHRIFSRALLTRWLNDRIRE